MGRLQTIDKARGLDGWVKELVGEVNQYLGSSSIESRGLIFPEHFNREEPYKGFVSIHIEHVPKEPDFLTGNDRTQWYARVIEVAKKRFGVKESSYRVLNCVEIGFEEKTEDDLYVLTKARESVIREGLSRIHKFVVWYAKAIANYERVITMAHESKLAEYLDELESL